MFTSRSLIRPILKCIYVPLFSVICGAAQAAEQAPALPIRANVIAATKGPSTIQQHAAVSRTDLHTPAKRDEDQGHEITSAGAVGELD